MFETSKLFLQYLQMASPSLVARHIHLDATSISDTEILATENMDFIMDTNVLPETQSIVGDAILEFRQGSSASPLEGATCYYGSVITRRIRRRLLVNVIN